MVFLFELYYYLCENKHNMEIKSKLELKTYVYYAGQKVQIMSKRYEGKHNTWMYEVENKKNDFKAFVKESELIN